MKLFRVSSDALSLELSAGSEREAALAFLKQCPDVMSGKISVTEIGGSIFCTPTDFPADNLRAILGYPNSQPLSEKKGDFETNINALKERHEDVIVAAILALDKDLDPRAIEPLAAVLSDWRVRVRHIAANTLVKYGTKAIDSLIHALGHVDWTARESAALALGELRDACAVEPLVRALNDTEMEVRGTAAKALGNIKDRRAVNPLIKTLNDPKWNVRECAAFALGEIGDASAADALRTALNDSVDPVVWAVRTALKKMSF